MEKTNKQVKIDESVYLLLEQKFLSEEFLSSGTLTLNDDERFMVAKFFVMKANAREYREKHIDDFYATQRMNKLLK